MIPIYRDTIFQMPSSASPFVYTITKDGEDIFRGKAWVAPAAEFIEININAIAKDFLTQKIPSFTDIDADPTHAIQESCESARASFAILNSANTIQNSWVMYYDWSYDELAFRSGNAFELSRPINGHGTDGMYYFNSYVSANTVYNIGASVVGAVNSKFSSLIGKSVYKSGYCGHYAIYYLNRYGGFDSLLCEGRCKRKDEYKRNTITTPYKNTTLDWGKRAYENNITPGWVLNTGFLTDSESDNLAFNLLSSNQVYVHDIDNMVIYPAIITDTSTEYKHHNNGQGMTNYTINLQASQKQINLG